MAFVDLHSVLRILKKLKLYSISTDGLYGRIFYFVQVISLLDSTKEEILKSIDMFCKLLETPVDKGTAHHSGTYGM